MLDLKVQPVPIGDQAVAYLEEPPVALSVGKDFIIERLFSLAVKDPEVVMIFFKLIDETSKCCRTRGGFDVFAG